MTEHHQDQPAGERIKKPRHKKFQNQSYGERMGAEPSYDAARDDSKPDARPVKGYRSEQRREDRGQRNRYDERGRDDRGSYRRDDRTGNDRPTYNRPTNDRPTTDRTDRPTYDRNERPSYDRNERPRYQRDDRPRFDRDDRRRFDGDERPRFQRDDRRADQGDRPSFKRDDRRGSDSDRPSFNRDDRRGSERTDRSRFDRDDRRSFDGGERPRFQRDDRGADQGGRPSFNRDDRARLDRDDRPRFQRDERRGADRTDRPRFDRDDRRRFDGDERSRFQRDERPRFEGDGRRFDPDEQRVRPSYDSRPTEETPVDLGTVAEDNKFAALGLAPRLVQRLARDGITSPFPIQEATIPDALAGKDVLGRGQTGSGKTLGFGLPTLMRLAGGHTESRRPRGMILVPTRELAMQVHDALEPLAHVMNVSLKLIAGGLPYPKQIESLRRGVDLLIATPGRLIDLCEQGAADLGAVEIAVLDEADHMCDMGFMPAVTTLLDMTPAEGQRLLFSATLDNDVDTIVKTYLKDPVVHSTDAAQAAVTTMEHHLLVIEPGHKQPLTAELASRDGRTIVFVRTKLGADRVATQLRDRGVMAAALHGGLTQGARNRTLDQFKDGSVPVLVATDVAARGIHVDDVGLVVQADPAADHKDYLHRAGRTARAGGTGAVVTLVLPHQRRGMVRLAESAGVEAEPVRARPGDELITGLTGGNKPSGYPVKLPAPKPRFSKGGGKGGRRFNSSRPGRGSNGPRRGNGPRRTDGKSYQH